MKTVNELIELCQKIQANELKTNFVIKANIRLTATFNPETFKYLISFSYELGNSKVYDFLIHPETDNKNEIQKHYWSVLSDCGRSLSVK